MGRSTSICHQRKEPASIAPLPSIKREETLLRASTPPHTQGMVKKSRYPLSISVTNCRRTPGKHPLLSKQKKQPANHTENENCMQDLLKVGANDLRMPWKRERFWEHDRHNALRKNPGISLPSQVLYAPWLVRRKWRPMQLPDRLGSSIGYRDEKGDGQKQSTTLSIRMPFDGRDHKSGPAPVCNQVGAGRVVIVSLLENRKKRVAKMMKSRARAYYRIEWIRN